MKKIPPHRVQSHADFYLTPLGKRAVRRDATILTRGGRHVQRPYRPPGQPREPVCGHKRPWRGAMNQSLAYSTALDRVPDAARLLVIEHRADRALSNQPPHASHLKNAQPHQSAARRRACR